MKKWVIIITAVSGALAVGLGAFGAHALKEHLMATGRLDTYETAVDYHFYHTLALLVIGLLSANVDNQWMRYSAYAMVAGILIFSGSLYVLCFTGVTLLGAITPLGGVGFIAGWVLLAIGIAKYKD